MKQHVFNIFLSLISLACVAQLKVINGEIHSSETKAPIQFVNIGIENKATGTVSSSNGKFSLKLNETINQNDSVTISHIGFKTRKIVCSALNKPTNIIELEAEPQTLNEVVVKFVKPKPKKIGRKSKGLGLMHMNFYTVYEKVVDDRLSKEVGMKFKVKKDCRINDFNFNITSNEFKSVKFRLNFYKVENGLPTESIVNKDVIFEIKDGFLGWYTVDLKPYELTLDKETEEIAVTIQWIESSKLNDRSKYFGISTALSATETSFYREKSMDTWTHSGQSLSFYLNALCK